MTRASQVSSGTTWTSEMALWKNEPRIVANSEAIQCGPSKPTHYPASGGDSVRSNFEYDGEPFSAWHFCDRCAPRAVRRCATIKGARFDPALHPQRDGPHLER